VQNDLGMYAVERSRFVITLGVIGCALLAASGAFGANQGDAEPFVEFTRIPKAGRGGTLSELATIEGRVIGARAGQQIVLYARSGAWFVQPFTDRPFTTIGPDSTWSSSTHVGTEYAALLVEPGYEPPAVLDVPPRTGAGVLAVAITAGVPPFWQTAWFRLICVLAGVAGILALYRLRMQQLANQLNLRFEERLAERTRIARELHDTLLQGFVSASMQLHVVADRLPADSPARASVVRVLDLMGKVIEEGRNAVRGLRSSSSAPHDLEQAFSGIHQELAVSEHAEYRVIIDGKARPLNPIIRDEVYRIGREALVNAFRHSGAKSVELELEYASNDLRMLVRDDGCGIDPQVVRSGSDGHWGMSGMRERAANIGASLKIRSRAPAGTEVELTVPGDVAFEQIVPARSGGSLANFFRKDATPRRQDTTEKHV
jgi:signal transduction histidine kinase